MEICYYLLKVSITTKLMFYFYVETTHFLNRTICKVIMVWSCSSLAHIYSYNHQQEHLWNSCCVRGPGPCPEHRLTEDDGSTWPLKA